MGARHRLHTADEWADLGARIRAARLKTGLTQVEAGALFGREQPFIAKIESGERQITALELRDLCRAFGVGSADLLGD